MNSVVVVIALLGGFIAWMQYELARMRFKYDLFEKRSTIYAALSALRNSIDILIDMHSLASSGVFPSPQEQEENDLILTDYENCKKVAPAAMFLFNAEIYASINGAIEDIAFVFPDRRKYYRHVVDKVGIVNYIGDARQSLRSVMLNMEPYLQIEEPPSIWAWLSGIFLRSWARATASVAMFGKWLRARASGRLLRPDQPSRQALMSRVAPGQGITLYGLTWDLPVIVFSAAEHAVERRSMRRKTGQSC